MGNNTYIFKVEFLDEDGYLLEKEIFAIEANSRDQAGDLIDEEISTNQSIYPSDNYEIQLLDTY